ncbi:MAG: methyltransferase domain-containing protein [Anaerolineae bacterium]|nr:methyltransferase domain-containing protein [Anaerolineae bacterium]
MAELLRQAEGTLLDVGARDRHLAARLDQHRLEYHSADLGEGCDYRVNLEEGLEFPDGAFDYVVALDVLEHVEHIHRAFHELARITRRCLIIALPNLSALSRRWSFLWRGHLGTKKYDLYPEHQGDRHRWLTVYPQINAFVEENAARTGLVLEQVFEELQGRRVARVLGYVAARSGLLPRGLLTERCIYVLVRR